MGKEQIRHDCYAPTDSVGCESDTTRNRWAVARESKSKDPHRGLIWQSERRCGLLALPEELQVEIMKRLRLPALLSVRLVCRQLRKLSSCLITTLNTSTDSLTHLDNRAEPILAEQLRALSSVTKLRHLRGDLRSTAALLAIPGCPPKLRELVLDFNAGMDTSIEMVDDFCARMKSATGVTSLRWLHGGHGGTLVPLVLSSSPQLVRLEVHW